MWKIVKGVLEASKNNHFPILGKGEDIESDGSAKSSVSLDMDLLV